MSYSYFERVLHLSFAYLEVAYLKQHIWRYCCMRNFQICTSPCMSYIWRERKSFASLFFDKNLRSQIVTGIRKQSSTICTVNQNHSSHLEFMHYRGKKTQFAIRNFPRYCNIEVSFKRNENHDVMMLTSWQGPGILLLNFKL